jgi:tRNA-dihydrouridine synthase B
MRSTRLEKWGVSFPFLVAPMVGLSHVAFRSLVRSYTPSSLKPLLFTEMLSTRKIPGEKLNTTNELKIAEGEQFYVPQLLGNEEKYIGPSVEKLASRSPFGFDINMGCPVAHTLKHNWGVRLMGDKHYAAEVVRMVKRHTSLPVSVKLRGGQGETEDLDFLLEFTEALENAGADWLTIHPRPRAQHHKGDANWTLVHEVQKRRSVPVVGNGNIQTADAALEAFERYDVDGVMIARAAVARPWILWQISEKLGIADKPLGRENQTCPHTPEEEGAEYARACLYLIKLFEENGMDEEYTLEKFRFFAATGARWFQFGHAFWKLTTQCKSVAVLKERVESFGETCANPMVGTIKHL